MSQVSRTPQFHGLDAGFLGLSRNFRVAQAVNGGIDFGASTQTAQGPGTAYSGNMNGQWANVTAPGAANVEFPIPHNLNRIPSFYLFISDSAAHLYQLPTTGTAWTQSNIYVKSDVASAKFRVFIT